MARVGNEASRSIGLAHDEFWRADHRKFYVVDGVTVWTGGAGIEEHFGNDRFHDVMVRVTGDVVPQAQTLLLTSFSAHGVVLDHGRQHRVVIDAQSDRLMRRDPAVVSPAAAFPLPAATPITQTTASTVATPETTSSPCCVGITITCCMNSTGVRSPSGPDTSSSTCRAAT